MGKTRVAPVLAGAVALLAASIPTFAQEGRPVNASGDVRVTSSGTVVLDQVYRSREITAFTDSISGIVSGGSAATADSENTFEGHAAVRLDVEWGGGVSFVLEVGTKRIDDDPVTGGILRWGDGQASAFSLREARILLTDLIPGLQVELGLSTWKFDVRGQGSSFAFDPRGSQTFERNLGSDGTLNIRDDAFLRLQEAAFVNDHEIVGATISYVVGGIKIELVVIPAHEERGSLQQDDSTYAFDIWVPFESLGPGSRAGFIVAVHDTPTDTFDAATGTPIAGANEHTKVYTVGGGTSLKVLQGLEVFGEGYFNFGKAGELNNNTNVKAKGRAFQGGVEWRHTLGNPMPIWFNFTYFYLSGEDSTNPANDEAGKFASFENVNDLMILEDRYFGFDWDSNYTGFKIKGGTKVSVAAENDLDITLIVGITKTSEDLNGPAGTTIDKLGNEVDVRLNWSLNKQFQLRFSGAYLFGSDILEAGLTIGGASSPEDKAWIWVMGFDLSF